MGHKTKIKGSDAHDPGVLPKDYSPGLGARLRLAREGYGSVKAFSEKSGISMGMISAAENEEHNLSLPYLIKWCRTAEVSPGTILDPDIDEFTLLVLAARANIKIADMKWLAQLPKNEAKIALNRARKEILLYRLEHSTEPAAEAEILSLQKSE